MKHLRTGVPFLLPLFALLAALYFLTPISSEPSSVTEIDALAPVEVFAESFKEPTGVVVDQSGAVFVSDRKSGDIIKITQSEVHPVITDLKRPVGLAFDLQGRLLVVEEKTGRLLRLETNGSQTALAQGMKRPRWVTVAEDGTVYISAKGLKSVKDKDEDDEEEEHGEVILRFSQGQLSVFVDGFKGLQGVVVHENNLFAAAKGLKAEKEDSGAVFKIPILPDGGAGPVSKITKNKIMKPFGLVLDALGALYVSAEEIELQKKHKDAIGKVVLDGTVTRFASKLEKPRGLALDGSGNLYVADDNGGKKGRIIRFRAPPPPLLTIPAFTKQSPLAVDGTTEANSHIDAFLNDSTNPTNSITLLTQDGSFNLTLPLTPNTQNLLSVFTTAHSGQGLTSASAEFTVIHDNIAPLIANLQPGNGSFLNNPRPLIRADFSDNLSGIDTGKVEVRLDGFDVTSQAQVAASSFTLDLLNCLNVLNCPLTQGQHTVSVTVFDRAGNSAFASTTFTIDVTAPLIANLTPANGSVVSTATPLIQASFSDNFGINLSSVKILLDGIDRTAQASISATGFTLDLALNCLNVLNCLNLSQGLHTVSVSLSDLAANSASASSTFTVSLGPQLNPIGNKTVNLGETLTFTVSATSSSGAVSLFVSPLPLPNHATFNAVTGLFTFTPDTTQVGSFQLTFSAVSDNQTVSETITITVPQPPPGGPTAVRGRIYNLNNTPLGNVKVTLKASGHTAFSSTDGFFTISGVPSGKQELIINGREALIDGRKDLPGVFAILAVPVNLIEGVLNNLPSPITLPDVDVEAEVPVSQTETTVVANPNVPGVVLTIPAATARNSDGTPYIGKLSINPVPDYGRPESRPEELRPGMAVTIQPAGIRFNPPAPLTFPNADGMVPGSELNLWSLSPDTGTFSMVGKGVVTPDGQSIITTEGGVSASAWHFFLALSGSNNTDVPESDGMNQNPTLCCEENVGSTVALNNGSVRSQFFPPSYRSLGVSRSLKFVYKSNRASPYLLIPFNATVPLRAAVPPKISYSLSVGGVDVGAETFIDSSGLDENRDETVRGVASFDASQLRTGVYPYRIKLTSNYLNSAISSFISDKALVVNEQKGFFGAGWGIEGLGKLDFSPDGSLVFTDGNGTALFFSGGPNSFNSPLGDFSTLVKNTDNSYTRTLKDGTRINFNAQGLQTSVVDRNGNTTSYSYDASGRPASIADPAGLATTFAYTGSLLSSIADPAGRATSLQYDAAANLTKVTFPDGSSRTFTYDSRHLMISESNERGFAVQREYDSAGRLVRATLPDGSIRDATNAQSIGFVDPSTASGTITNPAPVARPADALSTFRDGNGNQRTVKIGKFGAPLRITDSLGQTTIIERESAGNDGALQNGATFTTGRVGQGFSFDGINDFIEVPHNPNLDPQASFTIDAWVRTNSTASQIVVSKYECGQFCPSNVANSAYFLVLGAGKFIVFLRDTDAGGPDGRQIIRGTRFIADGAFHHIALVRDITGGQLSLYVDGTVDVSDPLNAGADSVIKDDDGEPDPFLIGAEMVGGQTTKTTFFSGAIDEVRFFNRALLASEIQATFTAGNVGNRATPPPGLISWWQGDGDATDAAGGNGLPTKIVRPNGAVVTMTYDSKGNLLTSTDPVGATTTFTYEPSFNQVASIRDPKGNTTTISYDAKGNPTQISDSQGNVTQMSYDARGLLTSVTDQQGKTTAFAYDIGGNLITTTDSLGRATTLQYDQAGNVTRSTDSESRVTEFTYDSFNRLVFVLDSSLNVTRYSYDAKGNLIEVIDTKNQITTFTYDAIDRLISTSNSLGFSESFAYDANGNLTSTTNRNLGVSTFDYDALNRLLRKTLPGNQVTSFAYDSVGNITSVVDPDSTVNMAYDLANRLTSTTASSPSMPAKTISYTYDLNGNRLTMTDPQAGVTSYAYDSLNRLTSVTNPSAKTTSFAYDSLGRRTSMTHANGAVTSYTYDAASQLLSLVHQLGATTVNSFSYTYDKVGNRKSKADNNGTANYTYDTLNRLVQAVNPLPSNPMETFTYDPVGNRVDSNQNGASTFNQANQLLEDASFTYQYDNNGNLTRKTPKTPGPFTSYEYDAENKLVRVVTNGTTINYKYDGLGRRVEKEVINVTTTVTRYVYDNEDILLELDGSNNITARYTHGPGIDEPLIMERNGQSFFYHVDGLGSITEITDSAGALRQQYVYSSFGKIESQLDPSFVQPYTFTAREFDPETDLYFHRGRSYDWKTGRFLQEDPIRFLGGMNFYTYVANNPINNVDPDGLLVINIAGAILGAGLSIGFDVLAGRPIDWGEAAKGAALGAIGTNPLVTRLIASAAVGFVDSLISQRKDCDDINLLKAFGSGLVSGATGAFANPLRGGPTGHFTAQQWSRVQPKDFEHFNNKQSRQIAQRLFETQLAEVFFQAGGEGLGRTAKELFSLK